MILVHYTIRTTGDVCNVRIHTYINFVIGLLYNNSLISSLSYLIRHIGRCFNRHPKDVCWFIGVINFASSARLPTELYTSSGIDCTTWQPHIRRGAINLRLSITHRLTLSLVRIHLLAFAGLADVRRDIMQFGNAFWLTLMAYIGLGQFRCCGWIFRPIYVS